MQAESLVNGKLYSFFNISMQNLSQVIRSEILEMSDRKILVCKHEGKQWFKRFENINHVCKFTSVGKKHH